MFVRARQRSRTALRAFRRDLIPAIGEVGVDRVQVRVTGVWRITPERNSDTLTTAEYFDHIGTASHDIDWFRQPERRPNGLSFQTRANAATTLGHMEVIVDGLNNSQGWLSVKLAGANPTRTLAHLLADFGSQPHFLTAIADLAPYRFFTIASVPIATAIGEMQDNWLEDPDLVLHCLGNDPFAAFLPIYVRQLQRFVACLFAPHPTYRLTSDGSHLLLADQGVTVRFHWNEVRVPQIECYFERHHVGAVGSVRAAASVALAETDMTDVHRYSRPTSDWVERQDDCLSIGFPLNDRYRLAVYAKSPTRLRFEVRRLKKGDYSHLPSPSTPEDRLLAILNMERENLLGAASWPRLGAMFDERVGPHITDLSRLCGLIAQVCAEHGGDVQHVMARLFEDGGVSRNGHDDVPEAVLDGLRKAGVLHREVIRRRDHRRPVKRYALVPEYRHLMDAVMAGLTAGIA